MQGPERAESGLGKGRAQQGGSPSCFLLFWLLCPPCLPVDVGPGLEPHLRRGMDLGPRISPCSPCRTYSAALAGLTRLSPPLVPGRWHQSPLHSQATEEGPLQASEGQLKQEQAEESGDSAGSPVPPGSLQR